MIWPWLALAAFTSLVGFAFGCAYTEDKYAPRLRSSGGWGWDDGDCGPIAWDDDQDDSELWDIATQELGMDHQGRITQPWRRGQ